MARYMDTATGDASHSVGRWLEDNLLPGMSAFLLQTAWFSYGALEPFDYAIADAVARDKPVLLVLGSNQGSLSQVDLARAWALIKAGASSGLVVVRYGNATFHPKTLYIERSDGTKTAIVGSANLTPPGMAWNVEAGIELDTADGDDSSTLDAIATAIRRWPGLIEPGVFPITDDAHIVKLVDDGIIDTPQAPKKVEPPQPAGKSGGRGTKRPATIGFRSRGWKPPPSTKPPAKTPAKVTPAKLKPPSGKPKAPAAPGVAKRWAKKLASSDAQKVKAGTKRTGKLRLTKSVFNIDHIQYFRYDLFAPQSWQAEVRSGGKTYEVAMVDFDVTFSGRSLGTRTLMIDFALHRVAKQKNVPTILAWGYGLAVELAKKDRTGDWVVIELLSDGSYRLVIQAARPAWA